MKKALIFKILLYLFFLIPLACSRGGQPTGLEDGEDEGDDGTSDPVAILVSRSTGTGGGEEETVFTPGCLFGMVVSGQAKYSNVQYKYPTTGTTLEAVAGTIYWESQVKSMKVDVYYPYREDGDYTTLRVLADQNGKTGEESNYYLSDALHASGTVEKGGNLKLSKFEHRASKVILLFNSDVDEVNILNQRLATGGSANNTIKAYRESARKWKACIIPGQTGLKLAVTRNGKNYGVSLVGSFDAGAQNTYSIFFSDFDLSHESLNISDDREYHVSQSSASATGNSITISGSPTVYIKNLNISAVTAINITSGTPTIILEGTNTLKSRDPYAGLQLSGESANVIIKGSGTLNATADGSAPSHISGAGIGSPRNGTCGNITIEGGTINAISGYCGAGIGAGAAEDIDSKAGNITIRNATVTATGGAGGAGIGTAYSIQHTSRCGNIIITNSTITATAGGSVSPNWGMAAAIGCGTPWGKSSICGNITITLKSGQTKEGFMSKLTGSADKVGYASPVEGDKGTCGTITWKNSDGTIVN